MKTKIISIDYLKANMEAIDKIKNKNFSNAILTLAKFQSGNFLLEDSDTEKIESVSENTVFAFNKALIKDISNSYDALEKSIFEIYKSDFSELLEDRMFIEGKEIKVEDLDTSIHLIDIETRDKARTIFEKEINEEDGKFYIDYYKQSGYNAKPKERGYTFEIEHSYGVQELQIKNKLFQTKNDAPITVIKDGVKTDSILMKNCFKILKKGIYSINSDSTPTEIDISPRLHFTNKAFENITKLDKYSYMYLTLKAEKFTYGFLKDKTTYISAKSARSTWTSRNSEYTIKAQQGKHELDDLNIEINTLKNIYQYSIDTNESKENLIQKLEAQKANSKHSVLSAMDYFIDKSLEKNDMLKESLSQMSVFYETIILSENISEYEEFKDIRRRNINVANKIEAIDEFKNKKKSIDASMEIFKQSKQEGYDITSNDMSLDEINDFLKKYIVRNRASIYDVKVDSFVLNMREDKIVMNDSLTREYNKSDEVKEIVENLKQNKYYDFFEFDRDFMMGKKEERKELLSFSKAILNQEMPVGVKNAFKVRKLGNLGGRGLSVGGLYSGFANMIVVDTRNNHFFKSAKHEETHRMDLNNTNKIGRRNLIGNLHNYFAERKEELGRPDYFLKEEELMARGGEIACMLMNGNYATYKKEYDKGSLSTEELWSKVKNDFESSLDFAMMKDYETYLSKPEYLDFENVLNPNSKESYIIDKSLEYFKPFFSNEETDVRKLLRNSTSIGNENREIEGIQTKNLNTNWSIDSDLKREVESYLREIGTSLQIKIKEIDFDNVNSLEVRSIEEVMVDWSKNLGDKEELIFHIDGGGITKDILSNTNEDALKYIFADDEIFMALKSKEIIKEEFIYTNTIGFLEEEKLELSKVFEKRLEKSYPFILGVYAELERDFTDNDLEILKSQGSKIVSYSEDKKLLYLDAINNDNFNGDKFEFLKADVLWKKQSEEVQDGLVRTIEKISKKQDITLEDLKKIDINNYEDYKILFVASEGSAVDFIKIHEAILDKSGLEYDKNLFYTDVLNGNRVYFSSNNIESENKIKLSLSNAESFLDKYFEDSGVNFRGIGDIFNNFEIADEDPLMLYAITIDKMLDAKEKCEGVLRRGLHDNPYELERVLRYAIENEKFSLFAKVHNFVSKKMETKYPNETIDIKGVNFFTKAPSKEKEFLTKEQIDNIFIFSDDLERSADLSRLYFAVENRDYEKIVDTLECFNYVKMVGALVALDYDYGETLFEDMCNREEGKKLPSGIVSEVEFFRKVGENKSTLPEKIGAYMNSILDGKKAHGYIRTELGEVLTGIATFSKGINEKDLKSCIDFSEMSRGTKTKANRIIENNFYYGDCYNSIDIVSVNRDFKDVAKGKYISKEDYADISKKVNGILAKLSFIDIEKRKELGKSIKKRISLTVEKDEKVNLSSLLIDKDKLKQYSIDTDKDEYFDLIFNQNNLFLLDEGMNSLKAEKETTPQIEKLDSLLLKLNYHYIKNEEEELSKGLEIANKILNSPMFKNLEINETRNNERIINRINDIKKDIGQVDIENNTNEPLEVENEAQRTI
ncbi:hypothetical protein [Poseidonibacter ostreae]|uniref:Uncharacterized protein n=1 Tax=Poseidonibacter ostreae TaxID=2654171 RepID=A0A6L4WX59_9BACT|nr:hypothetical protein [Poseidonibacter ostreae]KAB7891461.1 hypothetical protein GBG19_01070 [Poseidonibacter ostreae]